MQEPVAADDTAWLKPLSPKALSADARLRFAPGDAELISGMTFKSSLARELIADGNEAPGITEAWTFTLGTESVLLLIGPALLPVAEDLRAKKGLTVVFLDSTSLLAGEWNAVNRSVQLIFGPPTSAESAASTLRNLAKDADVWFFSTLPARTSIGIRLHDPIGAVAFYESPGAADPSPAQAGAPDGYRDVQFHKLRDGVELNISYAPEEVLELLKDAKTKCASILRLVGTPEPVANVAVIEGLDEGTRVVPLSKQ